jgi:hypothetical protein
MTSIARTAARYGLKGDLVSDRAAFLPTDSMIHIKDRTPGRPVSSQKLIKMLCAWKALSRLLGAFTGT